MHTIYEQIQPSTYDFETMDTEYANIFLSTYVCIYLRTYVHIRVRTWDERAGYVPRQVVIVGVVDDDDRSSYYLSVDS